MKMNEDWLFQTITEIQHDVQELVKKVSSLETRWSIWGIISGIGSGILASILVGITLHYIK